MTSRSWRAEWWLVFALTATLACVAGGKPAWTEYARQPDEWYRSAAGRQVIDAVLSWQSPLGGWPKNVDTTGKPFTGDRETLKGTFDNGATTDELRFLARAFHATGETRCREAVRKGIDHILQAQYPSGGWPQSFPPGRQYHRHITFNDGAMVRLMEFLREVAVSPDFAFLDKRHRQAAQAGFDRGVQCILKCQVNVQGRRTVWCAQHDEVDYRPRPGRSYELVSLSGAESAGILRLLMSLEHPSAEVMQAVQAGAEWYEAARVTGLRVVRVNGDRTVQADPQAPPLWARFYEIDTNRPIFSGRDGVKKYSMVEIEAERRNGYAWYGDWGQEVARGYSQWKEKRR